ncbi:MAG: S41 family peptidase [Acidimicrobiia bacterium]
MRLALALTALVVTACSTTVATTTTTLPSTTSTNTTPPSPPPPEATHYEVQACGSAVPRPWSILCRAVDLIEKRALFEPDMASLAAAAAAGVRQVTEGAPTPVAEPVTCHVPADEFLGVCDVVVDRHRFDGIPVDQLVEGAVRGLFRFGLDPYSSYLDSESAARLQSIGPGHVLSLGMVVGARDPSDSACSPLSATCRLTVLMVFDLGPASGVDIAPGDLVTAIDGIPVDGITETEAAARMSADAGATTVLTIESAGGAVTDHTLVHEDIRPASVEYGPATDTILYLRVNDFSQQAAQAVGQVLRSPDAVGIEGMILDLRGNPGGLVLSAQAVASQFLQSGSVLVEETRAGRVELPVLAGGLVPASVELVVIVDGASASAAEIVAAALSAAGRGTVIGQPTFGKNLVQEVFGAPGGGEYRITVARWLAPDGTDVGRGGLEPDLVVDTAGDVPIVEAVRLLEG